MNNIRGKSIHFMSGLKYFSEKISTTKEVSMVIQNLSWENHNHNQSNMHSIMLQGLHRIVIFNLKWIVCSKNHGIIS